MTYKLSGQTLRPETHVSASGDCLRVLSRWEEKELQEMSSKPSNRMGCGPVFLGAVLIHPFICLLVFAWGALFGSSQGMSPTTEGTTYGMKGGSNAVGLLFLIYYLSLGMVPLVLSGGGAVLGLIAVLWGRITARPQNRSNNPVCSRCGQRITIQPGTGHSDLCSRCGLRAGLNALPEE